MALSGRQIGFYRVFTLVVMALAASFFEAPLNAGDHLPFTFKTPDGWSEFKAPSVDAAWTPVEQKDLSSKTTTLMVHTRKKSSPYEFEGATTETVVAAVQKTRGALLRLSGLKDWTIDESSFEPLPGNKGRIMKMRGHYQGVINQPVEFFEWGYFIGANYYQISFHQPGPIPGKSAKAVKRYTPSEIEKLLSEFRPGGL